MRLTCKACHEQHKTEPTEGCRGCRVLQAVKKYRQGDRYYFVRNVRRQKHLTDLQRLALIDAYDHYQHLNRLGDEKSTAKAKEVLEYVEKLANMQKYKRVPKGTTVLEKESLKRLFRPPSEPITNTPNLEPNSAQKTE